MEPRSQLRYLRGTSVALAAIEEPRFGAPSFLSKGICPLKNESSPQTVTRRQERVVNTLPALDWTPGLFRCLGEQDNSDVLVEREVPCGGCRHLL